MSDLLLLDSKVHCPACHHKAVSAGGHCNQCGVRLFFHVVNFKRYESDGGIPNYWLWNGELGWLHRDHLINGLKPQSRILDLNPPAPNIKTAQERIADVKNQTRERIRQMTPRRNLFGYGKSKTSSV